MTRRKRLTRYAWLSIATAVLTILLKAIAYQLTGSVGLLSDALESGVNLVTAIFALGVLTIAARPPDAEHSYGHSKAEYLSSGLEGALIGLAAVVIFWTASQRLLAPEPLQMVGIGLSVSVVAAVANGFSGVVLLQAGRRYHSPTLAANGNHLLTDVLTTVAIVMGIGVVALTGWLWLDAVIALIVAVQIGVMGLKLVRESVNGLMDHALSPEELSQVEKILDRHASDNVGYHALRTRRAGAQRFVSVHIQVPGVWSVSRGHALLEDIERELHERLAPVSVMTHLEPVEDPVSWADIQLVRDYA